MNKIFPILYQYFKTRKLIFFILLTTVLAASVYFATKIQLEEDISNFLPNTPETERTNFVLKNMSTNDKIIIKLSTIDSTLSVSDAQDFLVACADSLVDSIQANTEKGYIKDILYKIDESKIAETGDFIMGNIPLYLSQGDYKRLDTMLTPGKILSTMEQNKRDLVSPMGFVFKKFLIADPLHISSQIFSEISKNAVDSLYNIYNGYIFSKDNKKLLIFVTSAHGIAETGKNEVLAKSLENNISRIKKSNPGKLTITSFGAAIVGVSNATQIKKDSLVSSVVSVILILLLLGVFFKNFRSLILLLVPVAFGVVFSLALLYFIKGTISAIAIGAGSAIFGIAINYTLHFLVHNKHSDSVERTIKDLVSPLLVGSITTIGAFLSLMFVSADALKDFGFFAALALSGTILFVLIFMPHFVKDTTSSSSHYPAFFDKISEFRLDKGWVMLCVVMLTVVFGYFSTNLTFESDMNKISYMTPEQKQAFEELSSFTNIAQKSIIHVSEGQDLNEALRNYESARPLIDSLQQTGDIHSISGIGTMLMSDSLQESRIKQWNDFWANRKNNVHESMENSCRATGFNVNSFDNFYGCINKTYTIKSHQELLTVAQFAAPYIIDKPGHSVVITLLYVNPQKEDMVKKTLGSHKGTFIFDRASANKATINVLSSDFNFVLMICAILVLLFITLSFGRLELSLLTFIPMVIGWIWILGLMAIFGVKFNIVNIILATFIFGLGDDYSIFIMEGTMHEYTYKRKILGSYKLAVILSALTMFIGIGSLIFAKHPAMKSLAQVTIIGMFSVVIISYTVLPFMYRWLTYTGGKKRMIPVTARNLGNSIWAFSVFVTGTLILKTLGLIMFKLTKPTEAKKLFFHKGLTFVAGFVVKHFPNMKTKVVYHAHEDFTKPAIIICNHQSHVDLMLMMMLSPRVIILTNQWVWNSPFFGKIVKYADFYPVSEGAENSIEPLKKLVEKGYSIMIFPEGTRSEDCTINRFHRGAFYLAEQLQLDILPIVIHGIGHVLPKTDFMLRKGQVTIDILPRIPIEDKTYGETYTQRAKYIRKMYNEHYKQIVSVVETPDYFADKVFHNYIYKGSAVSTQVNIDLKKHNNYKDLINLLPETGRVLVLGSGYGSFSLLLSMVKPGLLIDAVEADEDKVLLASNCPSCPDRLSYIEASPIDYTLEHQYDAIICIDFFSTLDKDQQTMFLKKYLPQTSHIFTSDIEYTWLNKLQLTITGNNTKNIRKIQEIDFNITSSQLSLSIRQKDNIFVLSI